MKPSLFTSQTTAALALLLSGTIPAMAQSFYSGGHADIGLAYEDGALEPHWHLETGNIVDGAPLPADSEYAPGELVAVFSGTRNAAAGSADYLGVAPGTPITMGGPSTAWQPYLGFGLEELDPAEWDGNIRLTLIGWSAPSGGEFALYTTNVSGTSTTDVFLSTFDPAVANVDGIGENTFYLFPGGHDHFTFGFTAPGSYELTFRYDGLHATDGPVSATGTFGFHVVPEPSSLVLFGLTSAGAFALRFRKKRTP